MALPLAPLGHQQFLGNSLALLAGGTLETYAAGTSTGKATASDSDGLVDNPLIITLNSAGRPSVNNAEVALYLKAGGYKFILKTSAGVVVWSQDNIVGSPVAPTVLIETATYAVTTADGPDVLVKGDATAGAMTVSLYTAIGNAGARVQVKKIDSSANAVTVDPSGTQTVDGQTTFTLANQWDGVQLESDGTNWITLSRSVAVDDVSSILANRVFN